MTIHQMLEGVKIFIKYIDDPNKEFIEAQHDQIWFPNEKNISDDDIERLKSLRFFLDKETNFWSHFT